MFHNRTYKFDDSPVAKTALELMKGFVKLEVTHYVRGRTSGTTFNKQFNEHQRRLLAFAQQDRDRKKRQKFAKLDFWFRTLAIATNIGLTGGRLGLAK